MRARFRRRLARDEQGAIVVMTAFMMIGLVLFAAIVIDLGNARDVRRQSQNAADASALAGANVMYPATGICKPPLLGAGPCLIDAVDEAKLYAQKNFKVSAGDWSTCTAPVGSALAYVPSGGTSCISFGPNGSAPKQVRVYLPTRLVRAFFGGIIGSTTIPVGSSAQAQLGQSVNCSLCFLGNVSAGNGDFSVNGGSIAVNGNVSAGPNSNWTSLANGIVGTVSGGVFSPPVTSVSSFSDPLASSLTLPLTTTGLSAKTNPCSATATGGPGLYGAFSLPNSTCTLQPGLYVISGTWNMGNNTALSGTGVTLYVKSPSGYLDFKNGNVAITAPLTSPLAGLPAGYAIIYDRNNTNNIGLQGNGNASITGAVYAPASSLDFNGNSCFGFNGGPIVVGSVVQANGNQSCVQITSAVDIPVTRKLMHLARLSP